MATPSLHAFGTDELKRRYLAPGHRRHRRSARSRSPSPTPAPTSPRCAPARSATATSWVINGSKLYITNGTQADWLCLLARTVRRAAATAGMSQIVVPTDTPRRDRVSRKLDKLGNRSSDTAELVFDGRPGAGGQHHRRPIGRGFQQQMTQFQTSG